MNKNQLEKLAKQLALESTNGFRSEGGRLKSLRQISPLWWRIHGQAWRDIAALSPAERPTAIAAFYK